MASYLELYYLLVSRARLFKTKDVFNVLLKFQMLISHIPEFFVEKLETVEKIREAFAVQKLLSFFQQKISVYLVIKL